MKIFQKKFFFGFISALIIIAFSSINIAYAENEDFRNLKKYVNSCNQNITPYLIVVKIKTQTLSLFKGNEQIYSFPISTSKYGIGQNIDSYQTPIGLHKIDGKFGQNAPDYAIFKARRFTGKIWKRPHTLSLTNLFGDVDDLIVTRILTLAGLEPGLNKGYSKNNINVDTKARNVYIHGTSLESQLGSPASIGCVYMASRDVKTLFNIVPKGTLVLITK